MPHVGERAPAFSLPSTRGAPRDLASLRGQKVVLYFYPRDHTPGCTQEACDFRDNLGRASAAGAVVLGVSKDSLATHESFRGKFGLPFELLTDADNAVATAYGAYGKKKLYGKETLGTIRSTFIIDEQGKIMARWSPVRVAGHVGAVLAALTGEVPVPPKASPSKKAPATKRIAKKKPAKTKKKAPKR